MERVEPASELKAADSPESSLTDAHALSANAVLQQLQVGRQGLHSEEATERLRRHGTNTLPAPPAVSVLQVIGRQFASPLIYTLLIAAAVSSAIGDLKDALFILAVLVLNATIGAAQEFRAERSADALRTLVTPRANVVRDREETVLDAALLVPGDIVVLESGMKIPADVRILSGTLDIDESLLTGESASVHKNPGAVLPPETPLAERSTMAFAGTTVAQGRAYGVVVTTGLDTKLGEIASSLSSTQSAKPPLVLRMEVFTRKVAIAVAVTVAVLSGLMLLRGDSPYQVFLGAVALAVSAIPEGLPVAMTVALAIAVRRMSRRKVIARRLAAVEALGSCTFIASDKTGTLTLNELTVKRVLLPGETPWEVTGAGVVPDGSVQVPPESQAQERARDQLSRLCTAVALCNDATLVHKSGSWTSRGDAVDVALLVLAEKQDISRAASETRAPRKAAIAFEAERQFAATVNDTAEGLVVFVKGAGEKLLAMCSQMATEHGDVPIDRAGLEAQAREVAAQGYRTLGVAKGPGRVLEGGEIDPACLSDLVFLGFVGMSDPLRPEAPEAIRRCRAAGIEVAMVTGDHPDTALAIASTLGLSTQAGQVVTGPTIAKLQALGTSAFDEAVAASRVFARVEPRQKLDIVEALIRQGHFVAVTGDGANDAPAMRAANIGVAMGGRGTDVARETGQLILADDNFASIVAGVEEGRIAYANVRKVIFLLVSTGAAELVLFALSMAFGLPLPLYPAQLLWLNLVTNGVQDVALAFEPGEGNELSRPPRSPREPIFNGIMLWRTVLSAAVMGGLTFSAFGWMLEQAWSVDAARNALLLLFVLLQNVQAGNARSEDRSLLRLSPLRNPLLLVGVLVAQLLHVGAMHLSPLREILNTSPAELGLWLNLLAVAMLLFLVMELEKLTRRWWVRRRALLA